MTTTSTAGAPNDEDAPASVTALADAVGSRNSIPTDPYPDGALNGGAGADSLDWGGSNDIVYAVDGEADAIDCGTGTDTVYFDSGLDTLAANCETRHAG